VDSAQRFAVEMAIDGSGDIDVVSGSAVVVPKIVAATTVAEDALGLEVAAVFAGFVGVAPELAVAVLEVVVGAAVEAIGDEVVGVGLLGGEIVGLGFVAAAEGAGQVALAVAGWTEKVE
jgi:hypothetical protein